VYEGAIRGLSLLRKDGWVDSIGPATELEIQVREPATSHTVSLQQLRRWCEGIAVSPAETIRKAKSLSSCSGAEFGLRRRDEHVSAVVRL
jgi:hypothetical protein